MFCPAAEGRLFGGERPDSPRGGAHRGGGVRRDNEWVGERSTEQFGEVANAVLVVWVGGRILRDTTHVLMEGTPRGMETDRVRAAMLGVAGVVDIHHLHLWNLASDVPALSAHVVVTGDPSLRDAQQIADQVRAILTDQFGLTHMTLEIESAPIGQSARVAPEAIEPA